MSAPKNIQVLVVDDSASVRKVMAEVLESDPALHVMATAADPFIAARHMQQRVPDVIVLDVEMPRMDGLTFLDKIMSQHPVPVVICSSLTADDSETALSALERGAVDVIAKPKLGSTQFIEESAREICERVKSAARARVRKRPPGGLQHRPKLSADAVLAKPRAMATAMAETTDRVVAIGASTGGTEALLEVLHALPVSAPGVVIVQHMPEKFTAQFAARLNAACAIAVKEAEHGDAVVPGQALVAPGNRHMLLKRSGARYHVDIVDGPVVNRHRPAVDVLFRSTARYAGKNALGVILTGMGDDGARGMLELKQAGAFTIAQDEDTSVVFGMPAEAIKLGGVDEVLPLGKIAGEVVRRARQ